MIFDLQAGERVTIPAGCYIALPSGTFRHALSDVVSRSYRLRFRGAFPLKAGFARAPLSAFPILDAMYRVSLPAERGVATMDHLLAALLCELEQPQSVALSHNDDMYRIGIQSWLDSAVNGTRNVAEGARDLGISSDHFSRIFRKYFGVSPKRYLMEQRYQRARELLSEENIAVAEVAKQVGVDDSSLFVAQFRKRFGLTPQAYRQRCIDNPD